MIAVKTPQGNRNGAGIDKNSPPCCAERRNALNPVPWPAGR